jgi:hypothetical protein
MFLMLGVVHALLAAGTELTTAEEINACHRSNFPDSTAVQTISLNARDRVGAIVTSRATLHWKKFEGGRSKIMMRFALPADLRGAGLLMIEKENRNDLIMYLPALQRVKRITKHMSSGSMFGTDFSYEEFERIQGISKDSPSERLEDDEVDGRGAYVLLSTPTPDQDSGYESIKTWIDKESCVALRTEFFEHGDRPRKIMTAPFEHVMQLAGIHVPRQILMQDHRDETETTLLVEELEVGVEVSRKMFSEKELLQGGR